MNEDSSKFETIEEFQQRNRTKDKYYSDYFANAPIEESLNRASECNATLHVYWVRLSTYVHGCYMNCQTQLNRFIQPINQKTRYYADIKLVIGTQINQLSVHSVQLMFK